MRDGKTYLAEQFVSSPLKIVRPFMLADGRAVLQILNIGPGVIAGDFLALDIRVERGAKVILINQSASKLHTMPQGSARQTVKLHVEDEAELEYYPGLTIPYYLAEFYQTTDVFLQTGAKFGMLERWTMGRAAHREAFKFRQVSSRLKVRREDKLIYADGLELTPTTAARLGISDHHSYLATGVWLWGNQQPDTAGDIVRPGLSETSLTQGSFGAGQYLRCVSSDGLEQSRQLSEALAQWRSASGLPELELSRFGQAV